MMPRVFQSPYLKVTESVSGLAVLWAFLFGPVYYWRKRAPVEALVLAVLDAALLFAPGEGIDLGLVEIDYASLVVWVASALAAPFLLPLCYRRKGWVELQPSYL